MRYDSNLQALQLQDVYCTLGFFSFCSSVSSGRDRRCGIVLEDPPYPGLEKGLGIDNEEEEDAGSGEAGKGVEEEGKGASMNAGTGGAAKLIAGEVEGTLEAAKLTGIAGNGDEGEGVGCFCSGFLRSFRFPPLLIRCARLGSRLLLFDLRIDSFSAAYRSSFSSGSTSSCSGNV